MATAKELHEPAALLHLGRFTRKGGRALGGRRWNVWFSRLKCPTCGREFARMDNVLRGREVRCIGRDQLRVRAKPKPMIDVAFNKWRNGCGNSGESGR